MDEITLNLAHKWTRQIIKELWTCRIDLLSRVMSDDVIAICSREQEYLSGPKMVIDQMRRLFDEIPTIRIIKMASHVIPLNDSDCLVIGRYLAQTGLDSGQLLMDEQRMSFLWRATSNKDVPLALFHFHISNPVPMDAKLYPVKNGHFSFEYLLSIVDTLHSTQNIQPIIFEAADKSLHLIPLDDIYYLEAQTKHTILHLKSINLDIPRGISKILDELPDNFVRIHRGYAVSAQVVATMRADKLTLHNGDILPVSRRLRTSARHQLIAALGGKTL